MPWVQLIPNIPSTPDGDGGSRLKKASSDKGLEEAEVSERSKGGGESEAAPGGRNNRMSYPAATAKGPLRKKRSSSSRLAGIGKYSIDESLDASKILIIELNVYLITFITNRLEKIKSPDVYI